MIRLVAFDLWKTLAYRDVGYSTTERILEETGAKIPKERFVKIFEESLQLRRWRSKIGAYRNLCTRMGLKPTRKNVNLLIGIRDAAESGARLYPFTIPMLKRLKRQGIETAIVSNSSIFQFNWIKEKTKLLDYVDYPVFSFQVGAIKPNLKIFRRLLKISGYKPNEVLMVGDKPKDDVFPPRKIGMSAIEYKNYKQLEKEFLKFSIDLK